MLPPGHAARLVWRFVEGLDLSAFTASIRSREGRAGRPAIDPKILVSLWLYATIDGVGSAREVDRLCYAHDAYRWLRGGVSVNYHTLSRFRVGHGAALDALLTQSITVLLDKQVVTVNRIAQDGTKIRASAGVRSFRRGERLRDCRQMARQQVARTKADADGAAPAARAAAQRRAADERLARVEEALAALPEVEAAKQRNGTKSAARVSTTDPDARVMKMADGGYRPAYNVQFATDVDGHAVVGVAVTNGGEPAELVPMLDQVQARTQRRPGAVFADGGFVSTAGICRRRGARGAALRAGPGGQARPGIGRGPDGSRGRGVAGADGDRRGEDALSPAGGHRGTRQCGHEGASGVAHGPGAGAPQSPHVGAVGGVGGERAAGDGDRPAPHDVGTEARADDVEGARHAGRPSERSRPR